MAHYTDKEQEDYLNLYYNEIYTLDEMIEMFSHFDVKPSTLVKAYQKQKLGTLQRKHDPIAFRTSKQDRSK